MDDKVAVTYEPLTETDGAGKRAARSSARQAAFRRYGLIALQILIIAAFFAYWEIGTRTGHISKFLFSSPSAILNVLQTRLENGLLLRDVQVTVMETLVGFMMGAIGGSIIGLSLWYSKFVFELAAPFITAIGSIPVLAIAPITIIWFGTDVLSKVVIVAFSCVVVSLTTAYRGAQRTDADLINLMRSFKASRTQIFTKLVVPAAMPWVFSGLKLNVGFALIGAIVAEYISSDKGVGNMILLGSSNFGMNIVLAGVVLVMAIMLGLTFIVSLIERMVLSWEKE